MYTDLARYLIHRYADMQEAADTGPLADAKRANATFTGACGAAHASGIGMTPTHVWGVVAETYDGFGPRPPGGAFPTARKDWDVQITDELAETLASIA